MNLLFSFKFSCFGRAEAGIYSSQQAVTQFIATQEYCVGRYFPIICCNIPIIINVIKLNISTYKIYKYDTKIIVEELKYLPLIQYWVSPSFGGVCTVPVSPRKTFTRLSRSIIHFQSVSKFSLKHCSIYIPILNLIARLEEFNKKAENSPRTICVTLRGE